MNSGVSVIVCCYNSSKRLPETIKHLALQKVPASVKWEVIIVDNASTDDTAAIAKTEWEKYGLTNPPFTVVNQPVAGLSHARDMGLSHAKYEYLLFCDDDNWLFDNYVERVFQIMSKDSQIGVLGGCGLIEAEQPVALSEKLLKSTTVWGPQTWAADSHWVYGAGSVYRKSILLELKKANWHQVTTGRIGKKLLSGEDVEMCLMNYLMGYKIVADDSLKFKHFVPLDRQNIAYVLKAAFWLNYSSVLLNGYFTLVNNKRTIEQSIKHDLILVAKSLARVIVSLSYQKAVKFRPISVEQKISYYQKCGQLKSLLTNRALIKDQYQHVKQILNTVKTSRALTGH
ncbi:Glycosyl transferase family 2 [Mucilaginibacter gossypiicola]|uniref:Glycosyl transferase family 2 n=1 Tax=Mucilaginibacter gossypiicola TaxID=551995 RepID=A0A1H8N2H5_9SPHI|nr:glycosyltransferase family A protein [Mucilaginibacter gossypiicola]SEO23831.1 Glycosyl transferase family 2 [Mucilaginibacter gossypiicola]